MTQLAALSIVLAALTVLSACSVGIDRYRVDDAVTLHRFTLPVSNVYVVEAPDGAVLVDAGDPGQAEDILEAIDDSGVKRDAIRAIVITHAHADHTGSAKALADELHVPIIIQREDAKRARKGKNPKLPAQNVTAVFLKWFLKSRWEPYVADVAYDQCVDLSQYGVPAEVVSAPGHTPGSSIVILRGGDVLVGDVLAGGFFGGKVSPKNPESHYYQEDPQAARAIIAWLVTTKAHYLYPGHGGPLRIGDVRDELDRGEFGDDDGTTYEPPACMKVPTR